MVRVSNKPQVLDGQLVTKAVIDWLGGEDQDMVKPIPIERNAGEH
jgi:hypothetical protein